MIQTIQRTSDSWRNTLAQRPLPLCSLLQLQPELKDPTISVKNLRHITSNTFVFYIRSPMTMIHSKCSFHTTDQAFRGPLSSKRSPLVWLLSRARARLMGWMILTISSTIIWWSLLLCAAVSVIATMKHGLILIFLGLGWAWVEIYRHLELITIEMVRKAKGRVQRA